MQINVNAILHYRQSNTEGELDQYSIFLNKNGNAIKKLSLSLKYFQLITNLVKIKVIDCKYLK